MSDIKPIFLFADSQLLFYKLDQNLFLEKIKKLILNDSKKVNDIKAAYIGASNGNNPIFYDIFKAAMKQIDINHCCMICSGSSEDEKEFMEKADIILLSGGDIKKGWDTIQKNHWDKIIFNRYKEGAVIIGISAGAIQLGLKLYYDETENVSFSNMLGIVPYIISVHEEDNWEKFKNQLRAESSDIEGFGIPFGGGIAYFPDKSIKSVAKPCFQIIKRNQKVHCKILKNIY